MPALMSSVMIYLSGRLVSDPVFSETSKGKTMVKLLLETELVREVSRGEFRAETHLLPITIYSWLCDQARTLKSGSAVTIACHLSGSQFTPPGGETKFGTQLIADALLFSSSPAPTTRRPDVG
jgi:single-stranded DNA-binding protein